MPWSDTPPAGNPICVRAGEAALPTFAGYNAVWVDSGTAALALGLMIARRKRPDIQAPEVVVPGYACPDLVAAARYAGLKPVLADIGVDDPGYDIAALPAALSRNTVALVAINFLGIRERMPELRAALRPWPSIALIEDNAQWFPEPAGGAGLVGDVAVLSFGRGKPVSLLGGGALLLRESFAAADAAAGLVAPAAGSDRLLQPKIRAYNLLLQPALYALISRNPLLPALGRTVFKPLQGITALDPLRRALLPANVQLYLAREESAAAGIHALLPSGMDLPAQAGDRRGRLLRYPVLCANLQERDALWDALRHAGLGATAMYRHALPEVQGVDAQVVVRSELKGARQFADRLLTLPTHAGVSSAVTAGIARIVRTLRR